MTTLKEFLNELKKQTVSKKVLTDKQLEMLWHTQDIYELLKQCTMRSRHEKSARMKFQQLSHDIKEW